MQIVRNLSVKVRTEEALDTLKENMTLHKNIVAEARTGYVAQAKKALLKKLDEIEKGKVVSLSFSLRPPQDYTKVYQTAIRMLELHTEDEIELDGSQ